MSRCSRPRWRQVHTPHWPPFLLLLLLLPAAVIILIVALILWLCSNAALAVHLIRFRGVVVVVI
jgi:hypothetical protein